MWEGKQAMLKDYKLIGVCVSRITEDECADFLHALFENMRGTDYRLMVYNSYAEVYAGNKNNLLERTVFHSMCFDKLDALVIADQCFMHKEIVEQLIEKAKAHGVPVVVLEQEYEGCFAVQPKYDEAFMDMIRHVIRTHGAKKLKYMGGVRGEYHSELRKMLFERTLAECGLPVSNEDTIYCDYWEGPVIRQIERWHEQGDMPDALICANDVMAAGACGQLRKYGLRVPEDVVVTGFDGLDFLRYHQPTLTTCKRNTQALGALTFSMVKKAVCGEEPVAAVAPYLMIPGESCGCQTEFDIDSLRRIANESNVKLLDGQIHEKQVFSLFGNVLRNTALHNLDKCLKAQLLDNSAVCMRDDLIEWVRSSKMEDMTSSLTAKMVVSSSNDGALHGKINTQFPLEEGYPGISALIDEEKMFLFQDVFADAELCGYYAVRTDNMPYICQRLHRIVNVMNGVISLIVSRMRQEYINENMLEMSWRDSLTGVMNLKGITAVINSRYDDMKGEGIALSVHTLPHYQFICENFGLSAADEAVCFVAESLRNNYPENALIARTENDKFIVINVAKDTAKTSKDLADIEARLRLTIDEANKQNGKGYTLELNSGSMVAEPGWTNDLISLIKVADGELYLNRLKQKNSTVLQQRKTAREDYALLDLLLKKNLFQYHFQPIVSARTGEICAYEALMRTNKDIGLSPMEVLRIAQEHFRLYDVEHATLYNVMAYVEEHFELFKGKRVYINSIPGCSLTDEDRQEFISRYSHLFHMCTIEITEHSEFTDEKEVLNIRNLNDGSNFCQLAIDDYGTGFSNIVNLLRYSPNVIKIDRYLIEDIQNDSNKQMFVRNTIEFARMNSIATLAEGVETFQELKKVIELGVDYVQGYYTARPSPEVIQAIQEDISSQIIEENLKNIRVGKGTHAYHAKNNETIRLLDLALKKYNVIEIHGGKTRLVGEKNHPIGMVVKVGEGCQCTLEMENVNMMGPSETTIQLGFDARCRLVVMGECTLQKEGILVPANSTLEIAGDGVLDVQNTRNNGVCIGASNSGTFGSIIVDMDGELKALAVGDQSVCIGGGTANEKSKLHFIRGSVTASAKAISGVVIGGRSGACNLRVEKDAKLDIHCAGKQFVGIGTESGTLSAALDGRIGFYGEGDMIVGIGSSAGGTGAVSIRSELLDIEFRGTNTSGIGSLNGGIDVYCHAEKIKIYGEGESVCGLGNVAGYGSLKIDYGLVDITLLAADRKYIGSKENRPIIEGGNILLDFEATPIYPVNSMGQPLQAMVIDEGDFSSHFEAEAGEYDYVAVRDPETKRLCVYVPEAKEIEV